ncbi:MAG: hypothetical protein H6Q28_95, partial [Bacteroidetes bacterium]|nr:hypothetical protein [Bacteroidota bacterium]
MQSEGYSVESTCRAMQRTTSVFPSPLTAENGITPP